MWVAVILKEAYLLSGHRLQEEQESKPQGASDF